ALGIVLAMLLFVYVADPRTHRWLRIMSVGIQPSEFAKPALILFLAFFLSRRAEQLNDRRTLAQVYLAVAMLAVLVMVGDIGNALVPLIPAAIVLWVAGLERQQLIRVGAAALLLCFIAVVSKGYRLGRIIAYVDPEYKLIDTIDTKGWI